MSLNSYLKELDDALEEFDDMSKIAKCTHQAGSFIISKRIGNKVVKFPHYCRRCDKCIVMQSKEQVETFSKVISRIEKSMPDGEWRKKIVDHDSNEAKAFKKKINRNQEGRYMEFDCVAEEGKREIWVYADKNSDDSYGEKDTPKETDWEKVIRSQKKKRKFSYGKGLKIKSAASSPKEKIEDPIKITFPQVVIEDGKREEEVTKLFENTHYIDNCYNGESIQQNILDQHEVLLDRLKELNIPFSPHKPATVIYSEKELIEEWETNVNLQLSILMHTGNKECANMDIVLSLEVKAMLEQGLIKDTFADVPF